MATIQTVIELQDNFSNVLYSVVNAVNLGLSAMEDLQHTMNAPIDTVFLDGAREAVNQAVIAVHELDEAMQSVSPPAGNAPTVPITVPIRPDVPDPLFETPEPEPVQVPVQWQSDNMEVFTGSGVERLEQEVQSANNMLNTLSQTQEQIAAAAAQTNIFPPNAVSDMNNMQSRLHIVQQRIQQIESTPLNMGTDAANAELEQLRGQLNQAVQEQENLNRAVESMDVEAANQAYLRLSQTVGNTERYIRDNVNEQGRFNREVQEGVDYAAQLQGMIAKAVGAFAGVAGIRKAFSFVEDCTEAFNTQLNAETQLISVLANMLDEDYVAQFELETTADTTGAIDEINAIQSSVDEVVVPVTAESRALVAAFDQITEKASEIQSRGIYGDEAMIAAAAEFSTYFTDTDAIEMMMDTLADYAMGMSGGGEIGSQEMVDYATNLGKIMSGAYDAMTKKGFELSDTQKAIIEGTATQEQIVSALGEEYLTMSQDMQAAAAISQVIEESWGGLYESMSDTPEGEIIQLTNAWGDMQETIGGQLYPAIIKIVRFINNNWNSIESIVQGVTNGLEFMLTVLEWIIECVVGVADFFVENWSWIAPIIGGATAALIAYNIALESYNIISGIAGTAGKVHAASLAMEQGATFAATAAQYGFNAALYACPLTWIILLVILLIAAIYGAVAAINTFTGTSMSATAIVCGSIMAIVATIGNAFGAVWNCVIDVFDSIVNFLIDIANFLGNIFVDPIGSICRLFFNLCDFVLSILQAIASAVDFVFGSDLARDWQNWRNDLSSWVDETFGKGEEVMAYVNSSDLKFDRIDTEDWFNKGVEFGENLDTTISDFFDFSGLNDTTAVTDDLSKYLSSLGSIDENTDDIKDLMDISEEDLKYLRDIAEQETVNRFTTAEINIEQNNSNNISSKLDLDGVVNGLTDAVNEAVCIISEGVHS